MSKILVSELSDDALDFAVGIVCHSRKFSLRPSRDWAQAGPIIDQAGISLIYDVSLVEEEDRRYRATVDPVEAEDCEYSYGATPLVAAMRCFVANKIGNEIEIPDEMVLNKNQQRMR